MQCCWLGHRFPHPPPRSCLLRDAGSSIWDLLYPGHCPDPGHNAGSVGDWTHLQTDNNNNNNKTSRHLLENVELLDQALTFYSNTLGQHQRRPSHQKSGQNSGRVNINHHDQKVAIINSQFKHNNKILVSCSLDSKL